MVPQVRFKAAIRSVLALLAVLAHYGCICRNPEIRLQSIILLACRKAILSVMLPFISNSVSYFVKQIGLLHLMLKAVAEV